MSDLLWMRAFREREARRVYRALVEGDAPLVEGRTIDNEAVLGIERPCVYLYLGRTHQDFGRAAAAYVRALPEGAVSPFDTGGLVRHIAPVSDWPAEQKRALLVSYTWHVSEIDTRLQQYPGGQPECLRTYLQWKAQPDLDGPHVVWAERLEAPGMWDASVNKWPAWTWECRVEGRGPGLDQITHWTCTDPQLQELQDLVEEMTDEEVGLLEVLMSRFVRGGTSHLVSMLREIQEVA